VSGFLSQLTHNTGRRFIQSAKEKPALTFKKRKVENHTFKKQQQKHRGRIDELKKPKEKPSLITQN
jgi:hypothetical protein